MGYTRTQKLNEIIELAKRKREPLEAAATAGNIAGWRSATRGFITVRIHVQALAEDTANAARGYLSHPKARRALGTAASDLEMIDIWLQEMIDYHFLPLLQGDTDTMRKLISDKLSPILIAMGRVDFAPPIPREKMRKQEVIAQANMEETSTTEAAYARAAAQLHQPAHSPKMAETIAKAMKAFTLPTAPKSDSILNKNGDVPPSVTELNEKELASRDEMRKALDDLAGS